MKKIRKHRQEQMFELIRKWEEGGLSQEQFFDKYKVAKSTFGYWRKKYLAESENNKAKSDFIPVKLEQPEVTAEEALAELELVYPNGVRLKFTSDIELSRLKPLIIL